MLFFLLHQVCIRGRNGIWSRDDTNYTSATRISCFRVACSGGHCKIGVCGHPLTNVSWRPSIYLEPLLIIWCVVPHTAAHTPRCSSLSRHDKRLINPFNPTPEFCTILSLDNIIAYFKRSSYPSDMINSKRWGACSFSVVVHRMDYMGVDEMYRKNAPPRVDTIPGYVSNNEQGKNMCLVFAWSVKSVVGYDLRRKVSNFALYRLSKRKECVSTFGDVPYI